ncbi:MAG: DUF6279 family lipoprotein, partial [Pseudomonadota bacterium]
LTSAQSEQLEQNLGHFFKWHRREELARYESFLNQAALYVSDGVTRDEFLELNQQVGDAWSRSISRAIEDIGILALTLTPQQIDHYQGYYRDRAEEFDEYLEKSPEERKLHRAYRGMARLHNWLGELDNKQWDRIFPLMQDLPDIYQPWIRFREHRHRALIRAFKNSTSEAAMRQELNNIFVNNQSQYARDFQQAREQYWLAYADMLEKISDWIKPEQFQNAVQKLKDYAEIAQGIREG